MTSTQLVQAEIKCFLQSPDPEVICVTGEWGVGKTYTWQRILDETKSVKTIALTVGRDRALNVPRIVLISKPDQSP
jgi:hypothetical protein